MLEQALKRIDEHKRNGVLVDSNLLLPMLLGAVDPDYAASIRAPKGFRVEHFHLLYKLIGDSKMLTTPNIATEVSNLVEGIGDHIREPVWNLLLKFLQEYDELHVDSRVASRDPVFLKIGLADTVLLCLAAKKTLVITLDRELAGRLEKAKYPVINFNDLLGCV